MADEARNGGGRAGPAGSGVDVERLCELFGEALLPYAAAGDCRSPQNSGPERASPPAAAGAPPKPVRVFLRGRTRVVVRRGPAVAAAMARRGQSAQPLTCSLPLLGAAFL